MKKIQLHSAVCAALLSAATLGTAQAQTTGSEVQRDVNQQQRIEQGLKSGELTTKEAAKLEQGEAKIEREQARALQDGKLTPAEKAKIQADQNRESAAIQKLKTNDQTGNPNSASSQRMQADVQRNVNQQQRIENGVKSGSLNKREVAGLERGQAKVDRREARAGRDGHVGAKEEARIQASENRQSKRIFKEKHDAEVRK
ncbi:MAG TPA: hypothetical protein VF928_10335 [Usitatibacteraceae bacterium]